MAVLVSSPKDLEKMVEREGAEELFDYLEMGGILRIERREEGVVVLYPTRQMIDERMRGLEEKRKEILVQLSKIRRIRKNRRILDPLRIKHHLLKTIDPEYRQISAILELDKMFSDERGRRIIQQIQRDPEYRKRVLEAVQESPVYKVKKFGDFVDRTEEVKGVLLGEKERMFKEMLNRVNKELETLRKLRKWVK